MALRLANERLDLRLQLADVGQLLLQRPHGIAVGSDLSSFFESDLRQIELLALNRFVNPHTDDVKLLAAVMLLHMLLELELLAARLSVVGIDTQNALDQIMRNAVVLLRDGVVCHLQQLVYKVTLYRVLDAREFEQELFRRLITI